MQRYWQQIIVPELGANGQQKIAGAKVLIVGAGGLGTPVAAYLAAAGVGEIGIVDGDTVTVSNLHRQFLYFEEEIGEGKAILLSRKIKLQNPGINVISYQTMLTKSNASAFINGYDVICDCTDDAATRILIDETCCGFKKPLVYAVVKDWEGYITVLHHTKNISLQNIFSYQSLLDNVSLQCAVTGIVNTTCGIAGSIQANEVIKVLLGLDSSLDGGILCFNAAVPVFKIFQLNGA